MIEVPGMLMIGSAGRNIGKTELACSLIRKFIAQRDIIGIKVTTIEQKGDKCPRGGKGCGVCSSLDGDFCITEGTGGPPDKDTVRMLEAGARQVFWLRVLKTHLADGVNDLIRRIGRDAISVCESNSLRLVVRPGLFLMVKDEKSNEYKASAGDVKDYADKTVPFNGSELNIDLDDIGLVETKWTLRMPATAIILAGGKSARMERDKSLLPIAGVPMIQHIYEQILSHFRQILVSADGAEDYAFLGATIVPDKAPGQGPLMGIASALEASAHELNVVLACDMPEIDIDFLKKMLSESDGYDAVVPVDADSRHEPLLAVYRKSMVGPMQETLSLGKRRIIDAFNTCKIRHIELGSASWLKNLNTMGDYQEFTEHRDSLKAWL